MRDTSAFVEYRDRFSSIIFERDARGVIQMTLHTDGGPFQWGGELIQEELSQAITAISNDADNHILILTGTGAVFSGPPPSARVLRGGPVYWERARARTFRWILGLLDFPGPVISCINGPAYRHSELPFLGDIVLAADDAVVYDRAHFASGIVPGDGIGLILPYLMGWSRARYFHFTGQQLGVQQMKDYGLVNEVMPREQLLPRAHAIADELAAAHPLVLSYSRRVLVAPLRALVSDNLGPSFALEALAQLAVAADSDAGQPDAPLRSGV